MQDTLSSGPLAPIFPKFHPFFWYFVLCFYHHIFPKILLAKSVQSYCHTFGSVNERVTNFTRRVFHTNSNTRKKPNQVYVTSCFVKDLLYNWYWKLNCWLLVQPDYFCIKGQTGPYAVDPWLSSPHLSTTLIIRN